MTQNGKVKPYCLFYLFDFDVFIGSMTAHTLSRPHF